MSDCVVASLRSGRGTARTYGTGLEAHFAERVGQRCAAVVDEILGPKRAEPFD